MSDAITAASAGEYAFFLALAVTVALGASYGAYTMLIRKRVMQDMPTALIRSASQGYIELQGRAELMEGLPVVSPLTMQPCVWYRYKVEEKVKTSHGNGSGNEWRTVASDTSDSLFYLVDSTGRCAVDPEGAKVTPSSRKVWYGNSRIPSRTQHTPAWSRFTGLAQIGRKFRFLEARINAGDPLYAIGDFVTHGGAGAEFDRGSEVREVLRDWKKDGEVMLNRFDTNNDGEIDMHEWDAARKAAEHEVDCKRAEVAVAPSVDVLGHAKGSRKPFILAAKTESEMTARFHWYAVSFLCLAALGWASAISMIAVR